MPPLFFCGIKQMPYSPMGKCFLENRSFGPLLCKEKPFLFANRFFPAALQIGVCRFASKFPVIARPVRRLVVAIPRLEGECTEKHPKTGGVAVFGGNRHPVPFNRGIATSHGFLAMTALSQCSKQQFIGLPRFPACHFKSSRSGISILSTRTPPCRIPISLSAICDCILRRYLV